LLLVVETALVLLGITMLATEDVVTLAWETQKTNFPLAHPTKVLICLKEFIRLLKKEFIISK
jgi:hypothetical protein